MYGNYSQAQTTGSTSPRTEAPNLKSDDQAAVAILQHLNKGELQNLLDDDRKLHDIVQDLQQVKNIQTEREMIMTRNKSVAEYNVSQQPKLDLLKTQLATAYEEANRLKTNLAVDKSKLDALRGEQSLDTLAVLLQTAAAKTEEEADEISDEFFDKKIDVDTFLEKYLSKRTLSHLRLVKSQKLTELMREQPNLGSQSGPQHTGNYNWGSGTHGGNYPTPPPVAQPGAGGALPYPTGSSYQGATFGMPQTGYYNHR